MNAENQTCRTVPGKSLAVKIAQPVIAEAASTATATILASFDAIKHMLSDKPLRRPNRTKPLA